MKKLLLSLALMSNAFLFADVNIYGLGGPHTALIDVAKEFKKDTGINVNVNFGPQKTWQDKAEKMEMPYLVHQISLH